MCDASSLDEALHIVKQHIDYIARRVGAALRVRRWLPSLNLDNFLIKSHAGDAKVLYSRR